jgi:hypothetical protein
MASEKSATMIGESADHPFITKAMHFAQKPYLAGELPELPFADGEFDLAICSHLLFTYSGQLSLDFHCRAVLKLYRVAEEVRIFPLLDLGGQPSPHVEPVCRLIEEHGGRWTVESVDYGFQRGGNQMLRICH